MPRLLSCFVGHPARIEMLPTNKHLICCVPCEVSSRQFNNFRDALQDWNREQSPHWERFLKDHPEHYKPWWLFLYRWWKGSFVPAVGGGKD